ncbi:hypothetical protein M378DRAFT_45978, partial [Amanita muscaria Koide BX008]
DTHEEVEMFAPLDCGTTGMFMDPEIADKFGFTLRELEAPIRVRNIDGTWNVGGEVTHELDTILHFDNHQER